MDTAQPLRTVNVSRQFSSDAARVFDAWLDPQLAGRWLFATPGGVMEKVAIEARKGGRFNITERRTAGSVAHFGEYLEVQRPRHLAFRFATTGFEDNFTEVYVDITPFESSSFNMVPAEKGGCSLTLRHDGVPAEYADKVQDGWAMVLQQLAATLGEVAAPEGRPD